MSKYSYVELVFENQRVDIINNNQFQTTVTFSGTGDQSKLLSVIISSYNRIKNDLYHGIHNFSVYQNDINKISDNGKFYKEINILESEISNPIKLLLKIFNKVTTTNLINNTDNYNEMSEGTFSTKLFTTQIKNIKSTTPSETTTVTTTPLETITVTKPPSETTTVTTGTTTPPVTTTVTTTTPPKPSNTAAEATGGAIGGGLATAKAAVTILKKKAIPTRNISTVTIGKKEVGYLDTETGNFVPASASDVTEEVASKIASGDYVPLYQFNNTKNLGSAYFTDDMVMYALDKGSLKLVKMFLSKQGPLYQYENPENGNEVFALDDNASQSQLYANVGGVDGLYPEITQIGVKQVGADSAGEPLYQFVNTEGKGMGAIFSLDDTATPNQLYANVDGDYVEINPVVNSSGKAAFVKGNKLYETADGKYYTLNDDGTVNLGLEGDPETESLTVQSINGATEGVVSAVGGEEVGVGGEVAVDLVDAALF